MDFTNDYGLASASPGEYKGRPFPQLQTWWIGGIEQSPSRHRCEDNPTAFIVQRTAGLGVVYADDIMYDRWDGHSVILDQEGDITRKYAQTYMRSIMAFLRYGVLYVDYATKIPQSGPGAGEYGPIKHMFPITPVELHKGWIKGCERIVACVSFDTAWQKAATPTVLTFDLAGRPIESGARVKITRVGDNSWRVFVNVADWHEFAIIE